MDAHRYELVVYWSDDDQVFIAEVPELPGCSAHGPTPAEAVMNVQRAIALWLDVARDSGHPIPEPRRGRFSGI